MELYEWQGSGLRGSLYRALWGNFCMNCDAVRWLGSGLELLQLPPRPQSRGPIEGRGLGARDWYDLHGLGAVAIAPIRWTEFVLTPWGVWLASPTDPLLTVVQAPRMRGERLTLQGAEAEIVARWPA